MFHYRVMRQQKIFYYLGRLFLVLCVGTLACLMGGCAVFHPTLKMTDLSRSFQKNTIISSRTGKAVSFDEMIRDLTTAQVVYIGEIHTDPHHHGIQLQILKQLSQAHPHLSVGMEMFDKTYQPLLDSWSRGDLDEGVFFGKGALVRQLEVSVQSL